MSNLSRKISSETRPRQIISVGASNLEIAFLMENLISLPSVYKDVILSAFRCKPQFKTLSFFYLNNFFVLFNHKSLHRDCAGVDLFFGPGIFPLPPRHESSGCQKTAMATSAYRTQRFCFGPGFFHANKAG